MIRPARLSDMAEILALLRKLHGLQSRPLPFDRSHCAKAVATAISAPDWLALVVETEGVTGLLIASVGVTTISPARVAHEHAWIAPRGWGAKLAAAYEDWARQEGCVAMSLACHPGDARLIETLQARGFGPAELTLVKVL